MLSIGDALPLHGILEGTIICNVEHHAGDCGTPSPGHPETTPSSSAATLTTAPRRGASPTEERPQRTATRPMMLSTLQCPSFFGSGDPFSAKAACTISSMLDDLQLDITLRIHERICEFFSP